MKKNEDKNNQLLKEKKLKKDERVEEETNRK